ncbi:MAG: hypothetical protein A2672_00850 [Candidatus Wildermuthbacteria bacterium RIFCSPHIGHO2_01_FULL_49_22b]|uniref:HTH arsR-type domain-containing protein n=1 Tax=Candidatus Wildermuthbacteria bacterium RIFCSPHIGHO2_01_FULL_49_22b TaxID=1802448 RepID=A0A1G2QZD4_9BACT|nr:MAG: hypothetical protein A2672_00850 [Candidatus Wildermuthbacteria bacterium RIFCSPHIGHO2_01_FULL_49_22b]
MKQFHELEHITRGISNHRRIEILNLLARHSDLSVLGVAEALRINFKTASEHIRRLALAGLVAKRYQGAALRLTPTPRGLVILKFLRTLE